MAPRRYSAAGVALAVFTVAITTINVTVFVAPTTAPKGAEGMRLRGAVQEPASAGWSLPSASSAFALSLALGVMVGVMPVSPVKAEDAAPAVAPSAAEELAKNRAESKKEAQRIGELLKKAAQTDLKAERAKKQAALVAAEGDKLPVGDTVEKSVADPVYRSPIEVKGIKGDNLGSAISNLPFQLPSFKLDFGSGGSSDAPKKEAPKKGAKKVIFSPADDIDDDEKSIFSENKPVALAIFLVPQALYFFFFIGGSTGWL